MAMIGSRRRRSDKEATDKLVDILKAVDNQVDQSGFFKEIGTGVRSEGSAASKIEAIAKEKVEKSGGTLDMMQAKAQAWKENPELRRPPSRCLKYLDSTDSSTRASQSNYF